jgi:hypothetical protein
MFRDALQAQSVRDFSERLLRVGSHNCSPRSGQEHLGSDPGHFRAKVPNRAPNPYHA